MKGRGANVLVNPVNVRCSGSRCVHLEWLFGWSENCVLYGALPESSYGLSAYAILAQSSYLECIIYLQRARFVIKNRTVLVQITSALLYVMCFGFFGNRGINTNCSCSPKLL
jgi:hypothetical protein